MSENRGSGRGGRNFETGQVKQSFSNRRTRTVQVERRIRKGAARDDPSSSSGDATRAREGGETAKPAFDRAQPAVARTEGAVGGQTSSPPRESDLRSAEAQAREQQEGAREGQREGPREGQQREGQGQRSSRPPRPAREGAGRTPSKGKGGGGGAKPKAAKPKAATPKVRETAKQRGGGKSTLKKVKPVFEKRQGRLTIRDALDEADREIERRRGRSLAAIKRARERQREQIMERLKSGEKVRREVVVPASVMVSDLANRMAEQLDDVLRVLVGLDITAVANDVIDADSAELVVAEFGHKAKRVDASDMETRLAAEGSEQHERFPRPPVVVVMGHVDHGKTSLLDVLRKSRVAESEAGGITQHIGASRVLHADGRSVTFLDTPGHEAFSLMRARGASATDLVVLVVAADDGVRAQTVEAINHAKAGDMPLIVGISKCDLPGADVPAVLDALELRGVLVEDKGGDVLCVPFSSQTGDGIDKLLEAVLLQADLGEMTAAREGICRGVVLESRTEKGHGVLASLLLREGTLRKGDVVLAGAHWGRIRVMLDEHGKPCAEALPSHPVQVSGLQGHFEAGEVFRTVANEARAREVGEHRAELRKTKRQAKSLASQSAPESVLEMLKQADIAAGIRRFPFIVKADAYGTLEVVLQSLANIVLTGAELLVLHGEVGDITESDVSLAAASGGQVLGFNAKPTAKARTLAKGLKVEMRFFSVLYELLEAVEGRLRQTLAPKTREVRLGLAEVKQVFLIGKVGSIAGAAVLEGTVRRGVRARVLRGEEREVVHEGRVKQLKSYKEEVREITKGAECGIAFENFQDLKVQDRIECFAVEQIEEIPAASAR